MSWRTFFYSSLCLAAALVVASASVSVGAGDGPAARQAVVAVQSVPVSAVPESARLVALVFGLIAILLTFQKAWENLRHRS